MRVLLLLLQQSRDRVLRVAARAAGGRAGGGVAPAARAVPARGAARHDAAPLHPARRHGLGGCRRRLFVVVVLAVAVRTTVRLRAKFYRVQRHAFRVFSRRLTWCCGKFCRYGLCRMLRMCAKLQAG